VSVITQKAGLYIRLSKEDGDKTESNSVMNQKKLLNQYIKTTDIEVYDFYIDDGKTGTNFEREAFIRLKEDIESKKINCVMIKDLSRLGREYIDSGYYIEKYFPSHNIRFISILDNIDLKRNESVGIEVPIKNVMNDYYAKDISKKIRATFDAKRKNGEFIGAFAPYGYKKDPDNKNHLIIDNDAAEVVRKIFGFYLEGMGSNSIARKLNDIGIIPPSLYKKQKGSNYINTNKLESTVYWTYTTVKRMLINQMYIGNMVQKRSQCLSYKIKKRIQISKDDHIIVEHTHEPIIDRDIWNKVQVLLSKRSRIIKNTDKVSMFASIIKCGDCGRTMAIKRDYNKTMDVEYLYYICRTYRVYGKDKCKSHSIRVEELESIVLKQINDYIHKMKLVIYDYHNNSDVNLLNNKINQLKMEQDKIFSLKQNIYEDWKLNDLAREDYLRFRDAYIEKESELVKKIEAINQEIHKMKNQSIINNKFTDHLKKYKVINHLDRTILLELVDTIEIYGDNRIEINWNFGS